MLAVDLTFELDLGCNVLCKRPFVRGVMAHPCGGCTPCRISRSRLWTHRMMLEALGHESNCFVTLTYDDEHLPENHSLAPDDTSKWLKRLRKALYPRTFRYFLVGEYGDETWRPHYHLALFGVGLSDAVLIQDTWKKGFTFTGELTKDSAQYIAGYVTKKLTTPDDEKNSKWRKDNGFLLGDRYPEFARMSLKPGIGALSLGPVADTLLGKFGELAMLNGDVPSSLIHSGRSFPLGQYLRKKLRVQIGNDTGQTPIESTLQYVEKMRDLFKDCKGHPKLKKKTYRQMIVAKNEQLVRNMEGRMRLFKKGKSL